MKATLILLVTAFLILTVNSCKQCTECVKYPAKDIKLCKKDYASDDSYTQAYRYITSQGYDCD